MKGPVIWAVLIPIVGAVMALVYLGRNQLQRAAVVALAAGISFGIWIGAVYPAAFGVKSSDVAGALGSALISDGDGYLAGTSCAHESGNAYKCIGTLEGETVSFSVTNDQDSGYLTYVQDY